MKKQKIVLQHPEGEIDNRKKRKNSISIQHESKTFGYTVNYSISLDTHMFFEAEHINSKPTILTFFNIGSEIPPELSEYSNSVTRMVFQKHIYSIKAVMGAIKQVTTCESVVLLIGWRNEQLSDYKDDDFEGFQKLAGESVNKSVKSVTIQADITQKDERICEIVRHQARALLQFGWIAWPEVTKLSVELPDNRYTYSMVKECLGDWKKLTGDHQKQFGHGENPSIIFESSHEFLRRKNKPKAGFNIQNTETNNPRNGGVDSNNGNHVASASEQVQVTENGVDVLLSNGDVDDDQLESQSSYNGFPPPISSSASSFVTDDEDTSDNVLKAETRHVVEDNSLLVGGRTHGNQPVNRYGYHEPEIVARVSPDNQAISVNLGIPVQPEIATDVKVPFIREKNPPSNNYTNSTRHSVNGRPNNDYANTLPSTRQRRGAYSNNLITLV